MNFITNKDSHADARQRGVVSYYALIALTTTVGVMAANLAPLEVSALMEKMSADASAAGGVVSIELTILALTSLVFAPRLRIHNAKAFAIAAAVANVFFNIVSAYAKDLTVFTFVRSLVGISGGVLWAVSCYWCGRSVRGVRAMGLAMAVSTLSASAAMAILPDFIQLYGMSAICSLLAGIAGISLFLLCTLQSPIFKESVAPQVGVRSNARVWSLALWMVLLIVVLTNSGAQNLWTYSDQLGVLKGFDKDTMSNILSLAMLLSVGGSAVAALIGERQGAVVPLVLSTAICGLACASMSLASEAWLFALGITIAQTGFYFMIPFQIGVAAKYDPSGRSSAVIGGAVLLSGAIAPFVGGIIFARLSPESIIWISAGMYWISALAAATLRKERAKYACEIVSE